MLLIENGANPNMKNKAGKTVMHYLIQGITVCSEDWKEQGMLSFKNLDNLHTIELIIDRLFRHKININNVDNKGNTVGHYLLGKTADMTLEFTKLLLHTLMTYGLDLNIKNNDGKYAFQSGIKSLQECWICKIILFAK